MIIDNLQRLRFPLGIFTKTSCFSFAMSIAIRTYSDVVEILVAMNGSLVRFGLANLIWPLGLVMAIVLVLWPRVHFSDAGRLDE